MRFDTAPLAGAPESPLSRAGRGQVSDNAVFLALWETLAWAAASRNASGKVAVARISPARPLARFRYSQIAIVEGLTYLAVKFPSISLPSLNVTKNFPEIDFRRPLHP